MNALAAGRYQVMPEIDSETFAALKSDIAKRGVITPIDVDETGAILDGHNRYRAWLDLNKNEPPPTIVRTGLTEDEKFAFARRQNLLRRHLSREQKQALIAEQISTAPNRSDRSIAADLGVDHKTVGAARRRLRQGGEIPHHHGTVRTEPPKAARDTPESVTRAILGGSAQVRANAKKVAALPVDLKLAFFEAGISADSVIVMPSEAAPQFDIEIEKKWELWIAFLVSLGWREDAAFDHTTWIRRGPDASPDEWLTGEETRKFRRTWKMHDPSDEFLSAWSKFKAEGGL